MVAWALRYGTAHSDLRSATGRLVPQPVAFTIDPDDLGVVQESIRVIE